MPGRLLAPSRHGAAQLGEVIGEIQLPVTDGGQAGATPGRVLHQVERDGGLAGVYRSAVAVRIDPGGPADLSAPAISVTLQPTTLSVISRPPATASLSSRLGSELALPSATERRTSASLSRLGTPLTSVFPVPAFPTPASSCPGRPRIRLTSPQALPGSAAFNPAVFPTVKEQVTGII
jgi:hypothetical protein